MTSTEHDGTAAVVVPVAVERLPLFYWRPGTRALFVGSRDGTSFDGEVAAAERNTFHRPLQAQVLTEIVRKAGCTAVCAGWSESLAFSRGLAVLRELGLPLIVATSGHGDGGVLAELLPVVDAWLLCADAQPGPHAETILAHARRVEVLCGLDGRPLPALDWHRAVAVHLVARRPAEADRLDAWCAAVHADWQADTPLHDHHHQHSDCACGARLVWRYAGRSRADAWDVERGNCRVCGRLTRFTAL